jgi:hypothetical protein
MRERSRIIPERPRPLLGRTTTLAGRVALALVWVFVFALGAFLASSAMGETGGDTFFANPRLALPLLVAGLAGLGAGIAGLVAMARWGERSLLMLLPVALGGFVAWFIVAVAW